MSMPAIILSSCKSNMSSIHHNSFEVAPERRYNDEKGQIVSNSKSVSYPVVFIIEFAEKLHVIVINNSYYSDCQDGIRIS